MKRALTILLGACLLLSCMTAAAASHPTLRPGQRGAEVLRLQQALRAAGYGLKADGIYGRATSQAVRQYQRLKSLRQDGIAGPMTLGLLYGAATPADPPSTGVDLPPKASYATLRYGMRGSEVSALQRALAAAGHALTADGVFGHQTRLAVRAYQGRNGLKVDGVAGAMTLARLFGQPGTDTDASQPPPPLPGNSEPQGAATIIRALRKGSDPAQIRLLQQALSKAGVGSLTADGVYGGKTAAAVRAFQSRYGLPASGTADPNTLALLYLVSGTASDAALKAAINNATGVLTMRAAASTAASAVQSVPAGGAMTLLAERDGWSLVSYKHKSGYVDSRQLMLLDAPAPLINLSRDFAPSAYAPTGDAKADLLGIAFTQLGFRGGNASNRILDGRGSDGPYSKYGDAYQDPGESYCSYFVSWSARQAGISRDIINDARDVDGLFYNRQQAFAYFFVPTAAQTQGQQLNPADRMARADYQPQAGDLIYYRWNGARASTTFSHIGIVYKVAGDLVYTIEGAAGGSVDTRLSRLQNPAIVGYARPRY